MRQLAIILAILGLSLPSFADTGDLINHAYTCNLHAAQSNSSSCVAVANAVCQAQQKKYKSGIVNAPVRDNPQSPNWRGEQIWCHKHWTED